MRGTVEDNLDTGDYQHVLRQVSYFGALSLGITDVLSYLLSIIVLLAQ